MLRHTSHLDSAEPEGPARLNGTQPAPAPLRPVETTLGRTLDRVFAAYSGIPFRVCLPDRTEWRSSVDPPAFGIVLKTREAMSALTSASDEARLGAQYVSGDLDVEGDLFLASRALPDIQACISSDTALWLRSGAAGIVEAMRRLTHSGLRHSETRDAAAIAYHYDKPSQFYRLWLGPSMVYSCAFFEDWSVTLEAAQREKLDLICRKLSLNSHDRFLDIGCGWGSLLLHAAKRFGVNAQGVSLSKEQVGYAEQAIAAAGLTGSCQAALQDYRELREVKFDKVSSVGMCEHVGSRKIRDYFHDVYEMMVDGGLFLNHGITRCVHAPKTSTSFIDRYVFPDGEILTLSEMIQAAEAAGFEVRDVEDLREHYEETLHRWVDALKQHRDEVIELTSAETYRVYELYMTGSAEAFRRGDMALHQILLSKNAHGRSSAVKTRSAWYRTDTRNAG